MKTPEEIRITELELTLQDLINRCGELEENGMKVPIWMDRVLIKAQECVNKYK